MYVLFRACAAVRPRTAGSCWAFCSAVGCWVSAPPKTWSTCWRSARASDCSDVSTSSSCTGVAVWLIPIVAPSWTVGLVGVHGRSGVLVAGDAGDLSDVDPRDPHRRVLADRHGRREHALHAEPVGERDVLGEAEVHG